MTSKRISLSSESFALEVSSATGALTRIASPSDRFKMNWICAPKESPLFQLSNSWGLGYASFRGGAIWRWQEPESVDASAAGTTSVYDIKSLRVRVSRSLTAEGFLDESFDFQNIGDSPLVMEGLSIATPWNDNYPDARTCQEKCCNAHVWCGGNVMYACSLRMGGTAPHLGLVMTEGEIKSYSIFGRGLKIGHSNSRGTIFLNTPACKLPPAGSLKISWRLFWHNGQDDFYSKARQIPEFMELSASSYVLPLGRETELHVASEKIYEPLRISLDGTQAAPLEIRNGHASMKLKPKAKGDCTVLCEYGKGRKTWLNLFIAPPFLELIQTRVKFIMEKQQVVDKDSPVCGAFLAYDNITKTPILDTWQTGFNEGCERLGMGVLLALWAQNKKGSADLETALRIHQRFVKEKLQTPSGEVKSAIDGPTDRLYNYPWAARLHLEMFHAYGERSFLSDFVWTCKAYYQNGGWQHYGIDVPILEGATALREAGMHTELEELMSSFRKHADALLAIGTEFPPHEVNYEQTIVGPAVLIPLEFYLLTGEKKYLEHAQRIMPMLEAFNGRQPDHRLNGIAIRHWDAYWFGRRKIWGDTFPHYWSSLSGMAFYRYWQATGDESYRAKARNTLLGSLSLFANDGSASCAYIYPALVDGEPARMNDETANDQDWALVFLLIAAKFDKGFDSLWS